MANCIIASPNLIDSGALSGGSWVATLPVTNLQNRLLGKVARSTNAVLTSTKFTITYASAIYADVLALVAHNFSQDAKYRVSASGGYNSGWLRLWAELPSDYLEWEQDRYWSGLPSAADIALFTKTLVHTMPADTNGTTWTIEIDDTANAAGYLQIGRVFIGVRFQPKYNMSYGAQIGFETGTSIEESLSGAEYFDRRNGYRVARLTLEHLTKNEAMGDVLSLQRNAGIDGEVLFIFDPDDLEWRIQTAFLGRLRSLSPIEHPYPLTHSAAFEIKEIL